MIDLDAMRESWPIIGGFVAGLVAWGKTTADAVSAKKSSSKAHERINDTQKDVSDIRECVARIETHYQHTMKSIDEIKKEIRREGGAQS